MTYQGEHWKQEMILNQTFSKLLKQGYKESLRIEIQELSIFYQIINEWKVNLKVWSSFNIIFCKRLTKSNNCIINCMITMNETLSFGPISIILTDFKFSFFLELLVTRSRIGFNFDTPSCSTFRLFLFTKFWRMLVTCYIYRITGE